jgi:hypothetical protein
LLAVLLPAAGCQTVDNPSAPDSIADLDEVGFRDQVEPILIRDCSYTACHGNADFPLRIYSIGKLRAAPPATLDQLTAPLTDAERRANFGSAAGFSFGGVDPDDNLLLRKALPAAAGGYEHKGGAIFTGGDDPRAVAIRSWLRGAP